MRIFFIFFPNLHRDSLAQRVRHWENGEEVLVKETFNKGRKNGFSNHILDIKASKAITIFFPESSRIDGMQSREVVFDKKVCLLLLHYLRNRFANSMQEGQIDSFIEVLLLSPSKLGYFPFVKSPNTSKEKEEGVIIPDKPLQIVKIRVKYSRNPGFFHCWITI